MPLQDSVCKSHGIGIMVLWEGGQGPCMGQDAGHINTVRVETGTGGTADVIELTGVAGIWSHTAVQSRIYSSVRSSACVSIQPPLYRRARWSGLAAYTSGCQ